MSPAGALLAAALAAAPAAPPAAAASLSVTGHLTGGSRAVLAETRVELALLPFGPGPAAVRPPPAVTAKARQDGSFALVAPAAGLYRVRVDAPGYLPLEIPVLPLVEDLALPPAHLVREWPQNRDLEDGSQVQWRPAAERGAEPSTAPRGPAPAPIAGLVLDRTTRKPLAGALVWCSTCPITPWTRAAADGAFRLLMPTRERCWLTAAAAGHVETSLETDPAPEATATFLLAPAAALAGVVVDGDGRPLAEVEVRARPSGELRGGNDFGGRPAAAPTGADGRFRLRGLFALQMYEIIAAREGHAPARLLARAPAAGGQAPPLRLVLSPGRSAAGRVVDPEGRPVAGVEVGLWHVAAGGGGARWPVEQSARGASDAAGRFQLRHLAAGDYELHLARAGFADALPLPVAVPEGSGEIALGDLVLERGLALEGRVVGPKGSPVEGAAVQATIWPAGGVRTYHPTLGEKETRTDAGGHFRIADLRRGSRVDVHVYHRDYSNGEAEELELPLSEPLLIELRPGGSLAIQVADPDGEPVAGATVGSFTETMVAMGSDPVQRTSGYATYGTTGADGSFLLDLGSGLLNLLISAPGYEERRLPGVEVPAGAQGRLDVVMRPKQGATLVGRVTDDAGQPLAGFRVTAAPEPPSGEWPGELQYRDPPVTGADGGYRLAGLPPGTFLVRAIGPDQRAARARARLAAGTQRLDLVVPRGTLVSGQVLDAAGRPIAGATAFLLTPTGGDARWSTTAADGSFLLDQVPDGSYLLRVEARGFATAEPADPIEVAGAPVAGLEVRLRKATGSISGRLLGFAAEDLARVELRAGLWFDGAEEPRGEILADGRYRIDELTPGAWRVTALVDGALEASGTVLLAEGQSEAVLDLEVEPGATVTGRVLLDGAPIAGVRVTAVGPGSAYARTSHDGVFRLRRLAPGRYTLALLDEERGLGLGRALEVGADDVEIAIEIASGSLAGRVTAGATGAPIEGAVVTLEGSNPDLRLVFSGPAVRTDAGGLFELPRLAPGGYVVKTEAEGFAPLETRVEIPEGGGLHVELPLVEAEH